MKFALTLLAALLACGQAMAAECSIKVVGSIDLTGALEKQAVVPVMVNGSAQKFMPYLDSFSGLRASTAKALQLRPAEVASGLFVLGKPVQSGVTISDFQVGAIHTKDFPMLWLRDDSFDGTAATGLLGLDFLSNYELELDAKNNKLTLISQDHCPGQLVYWTQAPYAKVPFERDPLGHIVIPMQLDGKPVRANISTLEDHATMSISQLQSLFGLGLTSPGMSPVTPAPTRGPAMYKYPFKTLAIGGIAIANPAIQISVREALQCDGKEHGAVQHNNGLSVSHISIIKCFNGGDVMLGLPELRRLHMLFSFKENMLYITPADAAK